MTLAITSPNCEAKEVRKESDIFVELLFSELLLLSSTDTETAATTPDIKKAFEMSFHQ